ncbi:mammalian cell related domain-containing protein [Alicycliphilus sp. B1]|nr:mammalian cell related domain-containing protein [Alicycliphilus sp. B1]
MNEPLPPPAPEELLRPVAHLRLKAAALLLLTLALIVGSVLYLLYARGAFEPTQPLVLTTDDSEGVSVGMDMTFSGFPIGRVRRIELAGDGNVRILVDVAQRDAHWLRESSVFTLVRGLVGGTAIKAYSGVLTDPPLAAGAERPVLRGDATGRDPAAHGHGAPAARQPAAAHRAGIGAGRHAGPGAPAERAHERAGRGAGRADGQRGRRAQGAADAGAHQPAARAHRRHGGPGRPAGLRRGGRALAWCPSCAPPWCR